MDTMTIPTASNGHRSLGGVPPSPPPAAHRRRRVPWMVAGVLLVVGCALAFAVTSLHLQSGQQVLVVCRSVPVGQVVTAGDLGVVRMSIGAELRPVAADEESSVLGRPTAVPLAAGTLLTASELGSSPGVTDGSDVVAVGLKAGQYPPSLGAGDRVRVVPVAGGSGVATAGGGKVTDITPVPATVLALNPAPDGSDSTAVASLSVSPADATTVAQLAAAGEVSLVQVPGASDTTGGTPR